ncbi:MAG: hypothetical protein ACR2NN_28870 [Bryobacteraceae bacterium]
MDAWAKMKGKDRLTEDGPSGWHLVPGAMEVVPRSGSLISHIQDRYEANINEVYGRLDGNPRANFDNYTPAGAKPGIRCSRPPLDWQTLDIDFPAPRFDAAERKTIAPRAMLLNAVRRGEAPTGPIQLLEYGMPVQFHNIWVVEGQKQ